MLDTDKGGTLEVDGELLQALQRIGQNIILSDLRIAMEQVQIQPLSVVRMSIREQVMNLSV
jgi:hypothetical protein